MAFKDKDLKEPRKNRFLGAGLLAVQTVSIVWSRHADKKYQYCYRPIKKSL